jgi:hypothetical protein
MLLFALLLFVNVFSLMLLIAFLLLSLYGINSIYNSV